MQFVQGGAGRLRVSDGGTGEPTIVLVHGLGSDLETWRPVLDRLRGSHRVVAYDQRGHGASEPAAEYSVDALADDLGRVVDALQLRRFWIVGHSFSGTVIGAYAAKRTERVAGVIYLDAVGDASRRPVEEREYFRKHDEGMTPARLRESYLEMLGPKAKPATRESVLGSSARMDLKAFATLRASMLTFDGLAAAAAHPGPRVAIEAEGNEFSVSGSRLPATRRILVPGVSHWLMLDDPDATARAIEEAVR
ncbi:MAG TPA: alpha/beta hydrolase [Myxococcales bacterium]|nr:alpha/beta hydrolase [Myxococcales bacterium]